MKRLILPLFALSLTGMPENLAFEMAKTASSVRGLLAVDRSLVERELQRLEADSAYPEASPSPAPFTLRQSEAIASGLSANTSEGLI